MLTIVYASRANRSLTEDDLTRLLADARARNEAVEVTGMLLYSQDTFLQQLEGDPAAVQETFARIERDARHTDVRVLSQREIADRRFPGWTMGFEHPEADALAERMPGFQSPGGAPLPSFELIFDAEVAEALLGLYAEDLRH